MTIDGSRVTALRRQRGWDQYELAQAAEVDRSVISRLERGRQGDYRLSVISRIAKALGVTIDNLIGEGSLDQPQALIPELRQTMSMVSREPAQTQQQVNDLINAYLSSVKIR